MCPASSFLKALLRHVILKMNSVVILDMEAGIEHLGRGTTKGIDIMLIVVEPGARSIETAGRIVELARQIDIRKFGAIINKAGGDVKEIEDKLDEYGIAVVGTIPYDTDLVRADMESIAPIDKGGAAVEAMKEIWKNIKKE
jgi:CO dehydrogenase maturation factor